MWAEFELMIGWIIVSLAALILIPIGVILAHWEPKDEEDDE